MFKTVNLKNLKSIFISIIFIYFFFSLFVFQKTMFLGIKKGFTFCFNLLIPSLFLFMVFSNFILNLNIKTPNLLNKVTNVLFKLPGCCSLAIFMGLLGGYPAGAVGVKTLLDNKKINQKQAEKLIFFLVGAGPAFIINVVGVSFFGSKFLGLLIFLSQFLASLILGFLISRFYLEKETTFLEENNKLEEKSKKDLLKIFIESVNEASKNLFYMCAFVIFFSAILSVLQKILESSIVSNFFNLMNINKEIIKSITALLFEVTNGCSLGAENHLPIYFLIFAISWAGVSVHLQIFYILKDLNFSKAKFIFFRVVHSIISTALFYLFLLFIKDSAQTIIRKSPCKTLMSSFGFIPSSIFFIITCICFILEITEKIQKNSNFSERKSYKSRKTKKANTN